MEREILFRGKRLDNGEWTYGFYVNIPVGRFDQNEHIIQTVKNSGKIGPLHGVDPYTVGQYTGLTDKNGVKIFEGDIIRDIDTGDSSEIIYTVPKFTRRTRDGWYLYHFCGGESYEVVGNVYDNQEKEDSHADDQ